MRFLLTLVIALTAAAGVAVAAVKHQQHAAHRGPLQMVATKKTFGITSIPVTGLYPGVKKTLSVRITNPYTSKIKVSAVTGKVARATGRAGCIGGASSLVVTASKKTSVGARKSVTVKVTLTMPRTVVNACQGAKFAISLAAKATK